MIKKLFIILFSLLMFSLTSQAAWFGKKSKPVLIFSSKDPRIQAEYDEKIENEDIFKTGQRIYFLVYTEKGFKADYIKYQVIKQDDKAHIGGYSRVRNVDCRISDKNFYVDYVVLSEAGKYAIQIFDIENHHHWIAFGHFRVVND